MSLFLLVQVTIGDYIQRTSVSNFRNSWEALDPGLEKVDEYGLGPRESLQEAVKAVIGTLGMQPVEVSRKTCEQQRASAVEKFGMLPATDLWPFYLSANEPFVTNSQA